jgi:hypothetical protein
MKTISLETKPRTTARPSYGLRELVSRWANDPDPADPIYRVELPLADLCLVVSSLWLAERKHLALAARAKREGLRSQESARRRFASRALALADRLTKINGRPRK